MNQTKIAVFLFGWTLGLAGTLAAAEQAPVAGAKELFYDPVGASATRLSPDASPKPPSSGKVQSPQPVRSPVRRDSQDRRVVNVPSTPAARASQASLGLS